MKRLLLLVPALMIISCSGRSIIIPSDALRQSYNNESSRLSIVSLIESDIKENNKILISVHEKSPEALQLIKFIIPVLHDRDQLNISFWFLDGNTDAEIKAFLNNTNDALTAEELLFNTDPRITGYQEYKELLLGIREFYGSLTNPENMIIGNSTDSFMRFSLFNSTNNMNSRSHYLVHSPLLVKNSKWELPFRGQLYFMMIHDWPLQHYSTIKIKDSILEDLFLTKQDQSDDRTVGSYLDGIILMSYPDNYTSFNSITSFINEENIADAVKFYPRQIIREKTKPAAYLVNSKIVRKHRKLSKSLEKEYIKILELEPYTEE